MFIAEMENMIFNNLLHDMQQKRYYITKRKSLPIVLCLILILKIVVWYFFNDFIGKSSFFRQIYDRYFTMLEKDLLLLSQQEF